MATNELIRQVDINDIARKGAKHYQHLKSEYELGHTGEFLAIETKSGAAFLGKTSAEALEAAREKYPHTVFYVAKIGFDVAEKVVQSWTKPR